MFDREPFQLCNIAYLIFRRPAEYFRIWQKCEISDFPSHLVAYSDVVFEPRCTCSNDAVGVQIGAGVQEIRCCTSPSKKVPKWTVLAHLVEFGGARSLALKHLKISHRQSHVVNRRVATLRHLGDLEAIKHNVCIDRADQQKHPCVE